MDYLFHLLVLFCLYGVLTTSLDLMLGHLGLLSLAHAAYYGIGAYTAALLSIHFNLPFIGSAVVATLAGALASFLAAIPSKGLKGDYFALLTFSLQMLTFHILNSWNGLTGGPLGVPGIPVPSILGVEINTVREMALLCAVCLVFVFFLVRRITTSPLGRALHAIREDEGLAESLGKTTFRITLQVCAISGGCAALAGALYAHYIQFLDPTSFTIVESILVLAMVILGGPGQLMGPLFGALTLVVLAEALRYIGIPDADAASFRQIVYGLALITMMFMRPDGITCPKQR